MPSHVLVVDDNPDTLSIMAVRLEHEGFTVETAADGAAAVEQASRRPPDVVLLDLHLPVLNGFEVLEELKRRHVSTRVIMYSGDWIDTGTAIRCIKAGACDYLTKPFDPGSVIERIRRHLVLERTLTTQVSELLPVKGIDYLGPLPADIQEVTVFSAGVHKAASQADAGRALLKFLTVPEAAAIIRGTGMEPGRD